MVVLVRGCCYGGHGISCCYLVLLRHISSSKAGFVQCFERRDQFRRSVFFWGAIFSNDLISVGVVTNKTQTYKTNLDQFRFLCSLVARVV